MIRLLTVVFLFPLLVSAQDLHTFSNGEVADAEKMNQNFEDLANELETLSSDLTLDGMANGHITVDCSANADALSAIVNSEPATRINSVTIEVLAGNCNFPTDADFFGRNVSIFTSEEGLDLIFPPFASFFVSNGHLILNNFALDGVGNVSLFQQASLRLQSVTFKSGGPEPYISVRSNSLLRLINAFESENFPVRPTIRVTANSELRISNQNVTASLGTVDVAMNSTFWCRYCQIDATALYLDTNSSFCGTVWDSNGNNEELDIGSLSVRAGSVFLHASAPSTPPTYATDVAADSVAIWDDSTVGANSRCYGR